MRTTSEPPSTLASPSRALKPGDILLFTNAHFMSLFITVLTRSPYYHAGIYEGDAKVIEMRIHGAVRRDLRDTGGARYFVVIPAPDDKGAAALQWAQSQMADKYDNIDLIVLALDRIFFHLHLNYTPRNSYTCGEFVAAAFEKVGIRLLPDIKIADTEPADFSRLVPSGAPVQTFRLRGRRWRWRYKSSHPRKSKTDPRNLGVLRPIKASDESKLESP